MQIRRNRWPLVLALLGLFCAALALPVLAQTDTPGPQKPAQRATPWRIATITYAYPDLNKPVKAALAKLGYVEGQNVVYRDWAGERNLAIMPKLAKEVVDWKPDVVLSLMTNAHVAMREATKADPIPVILWSADPLETGVIKSFRKTGTNFTGFTYEPFEAVLHVRLLKLAIPGLKCVGHLWNHTYPPAPSTLRDLHVAAQLMGIRVVEGEALTKDQIVPRIISFRKAGCDAFTVGPHELLNGNGQLIGETALQNRLAAVSIQTSIVRGGGLATYGPPHDKGWVAMAEMADRILKGAKPQDMPIERRLGSPLTLNLKAAKTLGLTLPPSLIDEADEVIE